MQPLYRTELVVNGKSYTYDNRPWWNTMADVTDVNNRLRTQPGYINCHIAATIYQTGTNIVAATYDNQTGWKFAN